ncbi:cell division protein FtsK [Pseudactinotalea sp. HY160]|uniref:FtsK/SpoIIIE domain-containing protein n=1 Tax=Pseudactinotalea sp. HY160 TaxID=2654490 RepID=UPI00128CBD10|nr:FtsK/SpoIIIE domain-containing protein [Pseudactinotalea sp. HY160]MPV51057.1 cell division protein FtsK [Pseudactinotalea sp. HY160]
MASKIERVTVKLPPAFDPRKHTPAVLSKIAAKHGEGWEVDAIDSSAHTLTASRFAQVTEVTTGGRSDEMVLGLGRGTKPSDGDRIAAKFEDAHPGFKLTRFDPYLGQATMARLEPKVIRAREALRVALGVKAWDVQVSATGDGGFLVELPNSYVPSKHDDKLTEVAEHVIGRPGWFVTPDPANLTARITPSDPPTFPAAIPTPMSRLGKGSRDHTAFGMKLPAPGEKKGDLISIDWTAQAFSLLAGMPGSGKSVCLNALISDALSHGNELVIVDDFSKRVDFLWAQDFVRAGGWGCDSLEGAVTTLAMVYEEGQRRAEVLAASGYVNWLDMPPGEQFTPIFIVVDEVSALLVTEKVPSGIPKDHPLVREAVETNLLKIKLASLISKIIAEQRFVGMRMVLSTQVTNNNTGIPPSLKAKIGHKILQGVNPSKTARAQAFSDESAVPVVPENVRSGGAAARGVGVADLEGETPAVYKSFFATTKDYQDRLRKLGVPTTNQPAPTPGQIAKYTPSLDDDGSDDSRPASRLDSGGGWGEAGGRDAPAPKLKGAAAAAHQLRVDAAIAAKAQKQAGQQQATQQSRGRGEGPA